MVLPKMFCLIGPKNFVRCPSVSQNFRYRKKFMGKRGGGVSPFSVKNFLSHSAEKFRSFVGEPFSVSLNSVIEKVYG